MKPINGYGFFIVSRSGLFTHIIIFEYIDKELKYFNLVKDKDRKAEEIKVLGENMQEFLNEEEMLINGERSYPHVEDVKIGFAGSKRLPYIQYVIRFQGKLREGINVYEDKFMPERTTYKYSVLWVFPPASEIVEAHLNVPSTIIEGSTLYIEVPKGTFLGGYERIVFRLPRSS